MSGNGAAVQGRLPPPRRDQASGSAGRLHCRLVGDDGLVFFPCGRFIEFYGPQRIVAVSALGLRSTALPRADYAFTAGFPVWLSGLYRSRAVKQGLIVVQVRQAPELLQHGCIPHLPYTVWMPL